MIKLSPNYWLCVVIALVALYASHRGIVAYEVSGAVKVARTELISKHQKELLQAASESRKTETHLQLNALALEKRKDEQITSLSGKLSSALERLQHRPTRPTTTNSPQTTTITEACTGAQLFKEDGEFLTREAHRADQIAIERDYYFEQYEAARKTLNEYSDSH